MNIDWAVVFATLVGPVLAVQTQKFLERSAERKNRRTRIFEALMTNRATRLSDAYVQALNQIDLEFHSKSDKPVLDTWHVLLGELNNAPTDVQDRTLMFAWIDKCNERLVQLLTAMSKALKLPHSQEQIRRGVYYPKGRVDLEQSHLAVLAGLQSLLDGSSPLKVENVGGAGPSELQIATLKKLHDAYDETGALRVTFTNPALERRNMN